jgi:hypothetical protein
MSNCCTIDDQACEWVVTLAEPVTPEEWVAFLTWIRVPAHFFVFMDHLCFSLTLDAQLAKWEGTLQDTQDT